LLRLHAQPRRVRGRRQRERPARRDARRGVAAVRAPDPAGVPSHPAARARDERLLHRPAHGIESGAVTWREWIRTVEIEPSLYAADFARLGEQIDVLLDA